LEALPAIALLLGGLGSLLGVWTTVRGQVSNTSEAQLTLAWQMQEKHLDTVTAENKELRLRERDCEDQLNRQNAELKQCQEVRRLLEIQIEVLKTRGQ
jgi:hypothetical protein